MIEVICGLPGSGKSYLLVYTALKHAKKRPVFSNFPIKGSYRLDVGWLKDKVFPANALLLIDEAGLEFNSREWASFPRETYLLFAQHRKYGLDVMLAVQHPKRLDKTIRELAGLFWWASAGLLWFRYDAYLCMEDFGVGKPVRTRYVLRSGRVYRAYDTCFMHVREERDMVAMEAWERGGAPTGSGEGRRVG